MAETFRRAVRSKTQKAMLSCERQELMLRILAGGCRRRRVLKLRPEPFFVCVGARRLLTTRIPAEAGGSTQRFRFNGDEEVAPRATRASEALVTEGTPERS